MYNENKTLKARCSTKITGIKVHCFTLKYNDLRSSNIIRTTDLK